LLGGLRGYAQLSRPVPGLPYRPRNVVLWEAALEGAQNYKPLRAWYGHFQPCKHPTISLIICQSKNAKSPLFMRVLENAMFFSRLEDI
jgi:hypothetical protein